MMKEAANRTEPLVKVMSILDELNRLGNSGRGRGFVKKQQANCRYRHGADE
ncbi:hypothetical protein [Paenibacillus validus]|uniref:hypothetical protein n=1 Tax=Paenibacillus validus TaxID=44253 RepID=UPI003D2B234A